MRRIARAVLAAALLCDVSLASAADPVAFVSDLSGEVVLNGSGRPPILTELLPGAKLVLQTQARAAVMYVVSGEEFVLKGPGEFVVARDGVIDAKGSALASRLPEIRVSAAVLVEVSKAVTAGFRMRGIVARTKEPSGPVYPVNSRIATLQPTLRWIGTPGTSYSVVVTSAAGHEFYRGIAKGSSLRLPGRLVAGQRYSWSFHSGESAMGNSRFETLPAEAITAAERASAVAKTFSERLLLALLLEDLGASQDSREVLAQLAAERPDLPELAEMSR